MNAIYLNEKCNKKSFHIDEKLKIESKYLMKIKIKN